jgi:hypothetical protein
LFVGSRPSREDAARAAEKAVTGFTPLRGYRSAGSGDLQIAGLLSAYSVEKLVAWPRAGRDGKIGLASVVGAAVVD